jgi:hypothetical protein
MDDEPLDPHAIARDAKRARGSAMRVSGQGLKRLRHDLDAQRARNAAAGIGPLTDEEVRRYGPARRPGSGEGGER